MGEGGVHGLAKIYAPLIIVNLLNHDPKKGTCKVCILRN